MLSALLLFRIRKFNPAKGLGQIVVSFIALQFIKNFNILQSSWGRREQDPCPT